MTKLQRLYENVSVFDSAMCAFYHEDDQREKARILVNLIQEWKFNGNESIVAKYCQYLRKLAPTLDEDFKAESLELANIIERLLKGE